MKAMQFFSLSTKLGLILFSISPVVTATGLYNVNSTARLITWSLAALLLIFGAWPERSRVVAILQRPVFAVSGMLFLWLFLRTLFSWNDFAWWGNWTRTDGLFMTGTCVILLAILSHEFSKNRNTLKLAAAVFLIGTVIAMLFGQETGSRLSGLVGNPLYLAQLLFFVPWAVSVLAVRWWIRLGATVIAVVLLWLTSVRGALIALLGACAVYAVSRWGKRALVPLIFGGVAMAVYLGVAFQAGRFTAFNEPTLVIRGRLWQDAVVQSKDFWLTGLGVGNQDKVFQASELHVAQILFGERPFDSSHNAYLDYYVVGGVIAVGLFVLWMWYTWRALENGDDLSSLHLRRATLAAFLLNGLTSFFTLWGFVPLLLMVASCAHESATQDSARNRMVGGVLLCFVGFQACYLVISLPQQAHTVYRIDEALIQNLPEPFFARLQEIGGPYVYARERDIHLLSDASKLASSNETVSGQQMVATFGPLFAKYTDKPLFAEEDHTLSVFALTVAELYTGDQKNTWLSRAKKHADASLEKSPERPASIFLLAQILYHQDKKDEAVKLLKDYTERHPELPKAQEMYKLMESIVRGG